MTPTSSASRKKKVKFSTPISTPETSHGTHRASAAGKPEAPTAETNPFTVLGEKDSTPSSSPPETKEKSIQGRKSGDPAHPVEAPSPPGHQHLTTSPPRLEQEKGEVTPSDIDIPDSIARALLDTLQEKWSGNQLPATMISLARIGASQLQQCLAMGRETSEATLDIISLGQEPPNLINLADKVSSVSHTLESTSNQPSTAVPTKINSSRRGLTPMAEAETSVQPDSL